MPATINYLSIEVTIGGHKIALVTDDPQRELYKLPDVSQPSLNDIQNNLGNALKAGFTLKMEKDKVIQINIGQLTNWISEKLDLPNSTTEKDKLNAFFSSIVTKPNSSNINDISIVLWNLSIGYNNRGGKANISFTFFVKADFNKGLLDIILKENGSNNQLAKFIDINSVGFGLTFSN
jgi:hypothetical protein